MTKIYSGVGSRETPPKVCQFMKRIAQRLDANGFTLRSGNAIGADRAFESGTHPSRLHSYLANHAEGDMAADKIFRNIHPYYNRFKNPYLINLQRRNVYQILGRDLECPSDFVLCWTPIGSETEKQVLDNGWRDGGTGFAISVASRYGVPVFNLKNEDALSRFYAFYAENYGDTND